MRNYNDINEFIDVSDESISIALHRDYLFDALRSLNIDLDEISRKKKKSDFEPYHRFNFLIKQLHEMKKIDITDICVIIENEVFDIKNLFNCLNEENMYNLRISLAERNGIKIKTNFLENFMYK